MFTIQSIATRKAWAGGTGACGGFAGPSAHAEDIDLFVANPLTQASAFPNIMIMLDNSSNWSREAQKWPGGDQGVAELQALQNLLAMPQNANIGLAMYTKVGNDMGGYIRFGIREMGSSTAGTANRTALSNILGLIKSNINAPIEKVNDSTGEAAALYEMYKYYKSMGPFRGAEPEYAQRRRAQQQRQFSRPHGLRPGAGRWLRHCAERRLFRAAGERCGRNYVIFIVNNAQGKIPRARNRTKASVPGLASDLRCVGRELDRRMGAFPVQQRNQRLHPGRLQRTAEQVAFAVLERAATVPAVQYFPAKNQEDIELAIKEILAEIRAINSTFAAASLPISATNRSQNLNQVFIGMFRPGGHEAQPRWMGNLKQYQLGTNASGVDLVDRLGTNAVNSQTGLRERMRRQPLDHRFGKLLGNCTRTALPRSGCTAFPTWTGSSAANGRICRTVRRWKKAAWPRSCAREQSAEHRHADAPWAPATGPS